MNEDRWSLWQRNVVDKFKDTPTETIKEELKKTSLPAAVLGFQIEGDFNFSNIIRTANFFNLSSVYYYGKKRFDKRGSVGCYHYSDVIYLPSMNELMQLKQQFRFIALENNVSRTTTNIKDYVWKSNSLVIVGEENAGIPSGVLDLCDDFVEIVGRGSVRSLNAATAAAIAISDYVNKY